MMYTYAKKWIVDSVVASTSSQIQRAQIFSARLLHCISRSTIAQASSQLAHSIKRGQEQAMAQGWGDTAGIWAAEGPVSEIFERDDGGLVAIWTYLRRTGVPWYVFSRTTRSEWKVLRPRKAFHCNGTVSQFASYRERHGRLIVNRSIKGKHIQDLWHFDLNSSFHTIQSKIT